MLKLFCFHECKMEVCHEHLSGMTCERYQSKMISPKLTSSTEASHARTLAVQEMESAWSESEAAYFSRPCGWPKKSDPSSFSLRTSQQLELVDSIGFAKNWPVPGMIVDGTLYPLKKLERHTEDKGGFCLPTPRATDGTNGGPNQTLKGKPSLTNRAVNWPTPQARDWKDGFTPMRHGQHSDSVSVVVAGLGHKGYLNPQFVEVLMGFQIGWTNLSALVMEWFRNKRKKPLKD
jgi:hypothetical protein